jgi:proline iminopeptidase
MRHLSRYFVFVILTFCLACADKSDSDTKSGYIEVPGGKVWYEIVGFNKPGIPLILLHGGPGFNSEYLRPMAALADERPVIFYDQLGSGKSDKPSDTSLWKIERFVQELAVVRQHLKLDTIHLFGHSWGTMLASEYLTTKPTGIKTVVFASPCLSTEKWITDANTLRTQLPQSVQDTLALHEKNGTTNSAAYVAATEQFYKRYLSRKPHTPELQKSIDDLNVEVYGTMWGNNEFTSTGNLKNFDRINDLRNISVPVLLPAVSLTKPHQEQLRGIPRK